MTSEVTLQAHISEEANSELKKFAKYWNCTDEEALEKVLTDYRSRLLQIEMLEQQLYGCWVA